MGVVFSILGVRLWNPCGQLHERLPSPLGQKPTGCAEVSMASGSLRTGKTMTATDVTELYAFFSARKSVNVLHILR